MADSGIGFDRSIDTTGYSPLASGAGDRGFADRPHRAGTPGAGRDSSAQDLASWISAHVRMVEFWRSGGGDRPSNGRSGERGGGT